MLAVFQEGDWRTFETPIMGKLGLVSADPQVAFETLAIKRKEFVKSERVNKYLALGAGRSVFSLGGDAWRNRRKLLQPSFSNAQLQKYCEVFQTLSQQTQQAVSGTEDQNATRLSSDFVTDGLAHLLLPHEGCPAHAVQTLVSFVGNEHVRDLNFAKQLATMNDDLKAAVAEIVANVASLERNRILDPMVDVVVEGGAQEDAVQALVDELRGLTIAGHETTAETAALFWWYIGRDPALQARLREEARTEVTVDCQTTHPLLTACFREVLRLHPPVPVIAREASVATTFDGVAIEAGQVVAIAVYALHRNPGYWQQPERFEPGRFLAAYETRAHLPFGVGARQCLGDRFALLELCVHAASVLRHWELETTGPEALHFSAGANLRAIEPVTARFRPTESKA